MFCVALITDATQRWLPARRKQSSHGQHLIGILFGLPGEDAKWLESAPTFDVAEQRMQQLATQQPGTYFIFNPWNCCVVSQLNAPAKLKIQAKIGQVLVERSGRFERNSDHYSYS